MEHSADHEKNLREIERHSYHLSNTKRYYQNFISDSDLGYKPTQQMVWRLPDLHIPERMFEMNFNPGSTVYPQDLADNPSVLYVGAGGGLELLQFAYFSRKPSGVIGVDIVDDMILECKKNLLEAEKINDWFQSNFVDLRKGDALYLPLEDNSVDVAAQNCLFNIFKMEDLKKALCEMYRVLKPGGRLVLSDPICEQTLPHYLRDNKMLRAKCVTGAITLNNYLQLIDETGFGTIEIRGRWPYFIIDKNRFEVDEHIHVESIEICAKKESSGFDEAQIYTGRRALYYGTEESFHANFGLTLPYNRPVAVSDQVAEKLESLDREDIYVSPSTYFYNGDLCC